MKIRVTTEFTDRYTGELHRIGEEMEVSVQRVNEILSVGNFIELVEQFEPEKEETKPFHEDQEESGAAGEQTGRRKRK